MKQLNFDNSYARLPQPFFERAEPQKVANPQLIKINQLLLEQVGLSCLKDLGSEELAEFFSGNKMFQGSEPIALAYAGHQFGVFVPLLGDGRACLLGEIVDQQGRRWDLQLKGSGQTAFSRRGDGRAALGPVIREYLVSEAMHRLGIPTSRSLAAVLTGENVIREKIYPGAVLTRVASSHLRIGTFELFAAQQDYQGLKILVDYAIERHYPELTNLADKYPEFLRAVCCRQAGLVAKWMAAGFIHGVLNTDNVSIAGETIDYGPCAFMDNYDPEKVFSYIDNHGRYAYGNQPEITAWNLTRLAESLLPLTGQPPESAIRAAQKILADFSSLYQQNWLKEFSAKIGIVDCCDTDRMLIDAFLDILLENEADFTLAFRGLSAELEGAEEAMREIFRNQFSQQTKLDKWLASWKSRLQMEGRAPHQIAAAMNLVNPAYIARNHLVERAINQAYQQDRFDSFNKLLEVLSQPYQYRQDCSEYMLAALPYEQVHYTFCGT